MAERSFTHEVGKLRLGAGQEFRGEGILAVTKALLQSGVGYVGGYQGAPISHLMDVLSDAQGLLKELGIHFEASASEAAAAAMLAASVNYPIRGAVTWKSTVGTNVASDALANVASGGVTGGALVIIGEDYGEGSSIMQERSHAFAMKSQMWLLDPRPNLESIVAMVERGFELSEASNTPVMLELRIRACHVYGSFIAHDNRPPPFTLQDALDTPMRDVNRIVLAAGELSARAGEDQSALAGRGGIHHQASAQRVSAAAATGDVGIILQGGLYNTLIRALELLGLADSTGETELPLYVLNVTYPLIDSEVIEFCRGKKAVLIVEEGQPEYLEQNLNTILRRADIAARVVGKDVLPKAGEYTGDVIQRGVRAFMRVYAPEQLERATPLLPPPPAELPKEVQALAPLLPIRPPGFCTGCPERPIFTAMKLLQRELGQVHISCDIGCHLFSILPPFNLGNTTMGYGLGAAGASAFNAPRNKRAIAVMGDGGFWHNGLTSGVGNAVFNQSDNVLVVVDNGYSAATGGQDILSSRADNRSKSTKHPIARGGQRRRREMAAGHRPHVRRRPHARRAARGDDDAGEGAEGRAGRVRMHAQSAASREACVQQGGRRRRAHGARALRRRSGYVHGRSLLHPAVRMPLADHQAQSRSAAPGSDRARGQFLRRLRSVRRSGACGGAVPVLLSRATGVQSDALGSRAAQPARARHRILPATRGAPQASSCLLSRGRCRSQSPRSAARAAVCWPTGWSRWRSCTAGSCRPLRFRASHSEQEPPSTTWRCARRRASRDVGRCWR